MIGRLFGSVVVFVLSPFLWLAAFATVVYHEEADDVWRDVDGSVSEFVALGVPAAAIVHWSKAAPEFPEEVSRR